MVEQINIRSHIHTPMEDTPTRFLVGKVFRLCFFVGEVWGISSQFFVGKIVFQKILAKGNRTYAPCMVYLFTYIYLIKIIKNQPLNAGKYTVPVPSIGPWVVRFSGVLPSKSRLGSHKVVGDDLGHPIRDRRVRPVRSQRFKERNSRFLAPGK